MRKSVLWGVGGMLVKGEDQGGRGMEARDMGEGWGWGGGWGVRVWSLDSSFDTETIFYE